MKRAHFFRAHVFLFSLCFYMTQLFWSVWFLSCWRDAGSTMLSHAWTKNKSNMHWSICQTVLWIECWRVEASLSISCLHKGSRANCEIVPRVPPFLDLCLGPSHRAHIMWCDADQISNHYAWKFWPVLYCSSAPRFPFCNSSAWSI